MKQQFITLKELNKRHTNSMFKYKIKPIKKVIGLSLIGVGLITLPVPTGSFILIGLGVGLLSPIRIMFFIFQCLD